MAGVPQADRGTVTFNDQVQDLVVEVRERGPDLVTVAAETVPAGDLVSQRAPEDKPLIEQAGNSRVVPRIPRARVKALNQIPHPVPPAWSA